MPVEITSEARLKRLICVELGDNQPDNEGTVGRIVDALWDKNAEYASDGVRLHQFYRTKLDAIEALMGNLLLDTASQTQATDTKNRLAILAQIQALTQSRLDVELKRAGATRPVLGGRLTNVSPISPASSPATVNSPDPNNREYAGDPLLPPHRRGANGGGYYW